MSFMSWFRDLWTLNSRSDDVLKELAEQRARSAAVKSDMDRVAGEQAAKRESIRAKVVAMPSQDIEPHDLLKTPRTQLKSSPG